MIMRWGVNGFMSQYYGHNPDGDFFDKHYNCWPFKPKGCRVLSKTVKVNGRECYVWSDTNGDEAIHYYFDAETYAYTGFNLTVPKERRR